MKHAIYVSDDSKGGWLIPLCIIELVGIALGSCAAIYSGYGETLQKYICPELNGGTALQIFGNTFFTLTAFLATAFLLGLFAFGQPFGIVLTACIGAELGCSAAVLYAEKGLSAIPIVLALYLPKTAAVSAVALLSARELLRTSSAIMLSMTGTSEPPRLKGYCLRYIVLFAAALIISAADSLIHYFGGKLIK